jgi:hypothetical protein
MGLLVFLLLLPSQHPDATASYRLGHTGATDAARQWLTQRGFDVAGFYPEASLRRATRLLDSLQHDFGRPATLRLLQSSAQDTLPAYYWNVTFYAPPASGSADRSDGYAYDDSQYLTVHLTRNGRPWSLENSLKAANDSSGQGSRVRVEPKALQTAFAPTPEGAASLRWETLPHAQLRQQLRFDFAPTKLPVDTTVPTLTEQAAFEAVAAGERVELDVRAAVAIARYHLARTALPQEALQADSVSVEQDRDGRVAQVHFISSAPVHGQRIDVGVTVSATGALHALTTSFNPGDSPDESVLAQIAEIAQAGVYALLYVILAILFFRRMAARLIDPRTALVDAVVVGLTLGLVVGLLRDLNMSGPATSIWIRLLLRVIAALVSGGVFSLFIFLVSAAADSLAHAVWPEKLLSFGLVRKGDFRNVYVGASLLRGTALAFLLLGLPALLLWLFPSLTLHFDSELAEEDTFHPMTFFACLSAFISYQIVVLALEGVGTFLRQASARPWVVVLGLALVLAVIQATPVSFSFQGLVPGFWLLNGVLLALCFWRYDLLTCFTGLFLYGLAWNLNDTWLIDQAPARLDALLGGLFVLTVLAVGVIGVMSRRAGAEVGTYVPPYVQEMATQERMKRELEIAQHVQESLLPRQMPQVDGLELAAMCLPAHEVGGDYYDLVELTPGRLLVVVGDVSGKGIQAGFYMTLTKGILRTLCREVASPAEVMTRLNTLFCENVPRGNFISMIYGILDVEARTFTFARAGHNPVILKRSPSQQAEFIQPPGLAIGLTDTPRFDRTIREETVPMRLGDVLVLYTDGFSEAMNTAHELYTDERLAAKVSHIGHHGADEILRLIAQDVHHFVESEGRHDDMTMVVVKLRPTVTPSTALPEAAHAGALA